MTEDYPTIYNLAYNNKYIEKISAAEYARIAHDLLGDKENAVPFTIDSKDYFILRRAAEETAKVPGLFLEIGLRGGGGLKFIIDEVSKSYLERTVVSIDPFGAIPFEGMEGEVAPDTIYTNQMMKTTLKFMHDYVYTLPRVNFLFFPLEDTEFMTRFADGVPVYVNSKKTLMNEYALVHFDGPHGTETTMAETVFFHERSPKGAIFVYDDVLYFYDHDKIRDFLIGHGWEQVAETKVKAAYRKVK